MGLVSLLCMGVTENASAQFGGIGGGRPVSARAKGAIIGGGLGAAAGAIIHRRDPVGGGIVGAVLGAGAGYAIGNSEDKRKIERQRAYYRGSNDYYGKRRLSRGYYRR